MNSDFVPLLKNRVRYILSYHVVKKNFFKNLKKILALRGLELPTLDLRHSWLYGPEKKIEKWLNILISACPILFPIRCNNYLYTFSFLCHLKCKYMCHYTWTVLMNIHFVVVVAVVYTPTFWMYHNTIWQVAKMREKQDVIELSKEYSIVTPFTSFVAIEKRDKVRQILLCLSQNRLPWIISSWKIEDSYPSLIW